MTSKQREQMLEFCRLSAGWYVNNQNTDEHPWGGMIHSADHGRFIYEYHPLTGRRGGNGVWGQAVAIMGLLALAERLGGAGDEYKKTAMAAAKYVLSLQTLGHRDDRLSGAFREASPQWDWLFPRDGATGGMGLCVLYRETKDEEYLYRAQLFADWYMRVAMNEDRWPAYSFDFIKREAEWKEPAVWQAGAGLMFYYLYKLTGEERYVEEGLKPLMEGYKRIYTEAGGIGEMGQDDFATISAMGACLLYDDAELVDCVQRRVEEALNDQDADGSCPGRAGAFQAGLTWQNYIRFVQEKRLDVDTAPYEKAIEKAIAFAPTIQERDPRDIRAYGGLYGQSNYSVSRGIIHHRSTGYSLIFMLRAEGGVLPKGYDVFEW